MLFRSKCKYYLLGQEIITVYTDHKPLIPLMKKNWLDIENTRLRRLREKLSAFNLDLIHVPGTANAAADAMTRLDISRRDQPCDNDIIAYIDYEMNTEIEDNLKQRHTYKCFLTLEDMIEESLKDDEYVELREFLTRDKGTPQEAKLNNDLFNFLKSQISTLSIYKGSLLIKNNRIVVPKALRQKVMELSHLSHAAFDRNYRHLTKYFYWPNMNNDVKIHTRSCPQCREYAASQPSKLWQPDSAKYDDYFAPFSHLGMDVFTYDNKNYLIIVCRYSGYPIVEKLPSLTTATIIEKLWGNMQRYGLPLAIRSDGARYFISEEMKDFCTKYGIKIGRAHV